MTIDNVETRTGLAERLKPRLAIEEHFAELGHTYRHGKAFRFFDRRILRPVLKTGLQSVGLYQMGRRNSLRLNVKRISLHFPELPAAFDGFRLLHLSDFHIDGVDGLAEKLETILQQIPSDLCVFTGDYRFEDRGSCDGVYPRMRKVVDAISAEHGIVGILGNHDSAEIAYGLEELGVRMLVNEGFEIRRDGASLWIAGIDDPFDYRCHDLRASLKDAPPQAFKILLAHAPEVYVEAAALGFSLCLSGHTHAGQIRLPIWGALKHNSHCPKEYAFGLWKYGEMQGYTTSGVGCSSVPVRLGCPPEVVVFELKRDSKTLK